MAAFAGWQRHLHLAKESTWGVLALAPVFLPVPHSVYDVRPRARSAQGALFTGLRQRRHHAILRAALAGSLRLPLFAHHLAGMSLGQYLLEWLFSAPNGLALDSYTADLFEADTDNKRHLGLRVGAGTLAGDAESGRIQLVLDLVGKEEVGGISPPTLNPATPAPMECLFKDCLFSLTGVNVPIASFELRVANNPRIVHSGGYWPAHISAGTREVTFRYRAWKTAGVFDLARRVPPTEMNAQLVLKGPHNGTGPAGSFTVITINFPRLGFRDATEVGGLDDLASQEIEFTALKPSNSSNEIDVTFSTE